MDVTRRSVLTGLAAGALAPWLLGKADGEETASPVLREFKGEDFYKPDGSFDVEAGKNAFYDMMRSHNYPIVPRLRGEEFWTLDFGLGKYLEVGMAGIFWVNNQADNYFGHEIYLLPGQMIPEHRHVKTPDADPKMEAWQVRHGWVYIYGEGDPTAGVDARIPESHKKCCNARREQKLMPGEVGQLSDASEWHWMLAGPEGAIVTEYATYHDGNALQFSHPDVKM